MPYKNKKDQLKYNSKYHREYRRKLRRAVLAYLGNKCVRCGFADSRALQVDHIYGHGKYELRGPDRYKKMYQEILAGNRPDLQLLCANCNWIKRAENGEDGNAD